METRMEPDQIVSAVVFVVDGLWCRTRREAENLAWRVYGGDVPIEQQNVQIPYAEAAARQLNWWASR